MKTSYKEIGKQILVLLAALAGALLIGAIFLLLAKSNPVKAYTIMLTGPFSDLFGITETLVRSVPLLLVGLGIIISFRCGIVNIGAEGQMMAGAIGAAAAANYFSGVSSLVLLPLVLIAGAASGAIWGGIAGWLKARLAVNEILSTVMLNQIAFQLYLFLIRGPLIDPNEVSYGTGTPQTALVPEGIWLERLVPTRLHSGLVLAVVLAIAVYLFLWKTSIGYRLRAVGAGMDAAKYAGINVQWYVVLAMLLAGGMAGLAGTVEVIGVHHRAMEGLSAGYGFSGIVAALFGRLHPIGTIPASILFGSLLLGADMMQRAVSVPAAMVMAIQGLVVLFVVASDYFLTQPIKFKSFKDRFSSNKSANESGK